ncbi:hypothetical protein EDL79_03940 [Ehrlichia ruminantium]|uniref:Uncharacterized protein n=1 Tax=Ehrlichia ruminantium TaxID=779 RepID=A0AAE6UIP9_EHRRU|nr:hypothetical protein [Ehrlichia ruminantium]QGR02767.1 hypothetical protein EDL81_03930 [Ehrlichia ruminantium]QGR03687.1 hypothetical protein EDL80_03930 [Ehrlichia ruminantium]QGR04614.1 hypothetical protein EDL79_03940 [Ehrlichia ruminantium]
MKIEMLVLLVTVLLAVIIIVVSCVIYCSRKVCEVSEQNALINNGIEKERSDSSEAICHTIAHDLHEGNYDDTEMDFSDDEDVSYNKQDRARLPILIDDTKLNSVPLRDCSQIWCGERRGEGLQQGNGVCLTSVGALGYKCHSSSIMYPMSSERVDCQDEILPVSYNLSGSGSSDILLDQSCSKSIFESDRLYSTSGLFSGVGHFNSAGADCDSLIGDTCGYERLSSKGFSSERCKVGVKPHDSIGEFASNRGRIFGEIARQDDMGHTLPTAGLLDNVLSSDSSQSAGCGLGDATACNSSIQTQDVILDKPVSELLKNVVSPNPVLQVDQMDTADIEKSMPDLLACCLQRSDSSKDDGVDNTGVHNDRVLCSIGPHNIESRLSTVMHNAVDQQFLNQVAGMTFESLLKMLSNMDSNIRFMLNSAEINLYLILNDPMMNIRLMCSHPRIFQAAIHTRYAISGSCGSRSMSTTSTRSRKIHLHSKKFPCVSKRKSTMARVCRGQKVSVISSKANGTCLTRNVNQSSKEDTANHTMLPLNGTIRITQVMDRNISTMGLPYNRSDQSLVRHTINRRSIGHYVDGESTMENQELACLDTGELRKQQYLDSTYLRRTCAYEAPSMSTQVVQSVMRVDPNDSLDAVLKLEYDRLDNILLEMNDRSLQNKIRDECLNVHSMILQVMQCIDQEVIYPTIQSWVVQRGEALYNKHKVTLVRDCIRLLTSDIKGSCTDKSCRQALVSRLTHKVESYIRSEYIIQVHNIARKKAITMAYKNVLVMMTNKVRSKHTIIQNVVKGYVKHTNNPKKGMLSALVSKIVNDREELDVFRSFHKLANFFMNKAKVRTISIVRESLKEHKQEISSTVVRNSVIEKIRNSVCNGFEESPSSHMNCIIGDESNVISLGLTQAKHRIF